jgi:Uma2 family endonuclease
MPTITLKRPRLQRSRLWIGPDSAGVRMTPSEFDRAEFVEGWRYELIKGVLVVSPIPLEAERDPNEELGHWLRTYQESHPEGTILDKTLAEHTVVTGENRRRVDRILWIGLGRLPTLEDVASILVEFVSEGKRSWQRDYVDKRDEYLALGVKESWIIDRFERTLTVYSKQGKRIKKRIVAEAETYTTPLLPGFQLPLARLLALADAWQQRS